MCKNEQDTVFIKFTVRALVLNLMSIICPGQNESMQAFHFLLCSDFPERLREAVSGAELPGSVWGQKRVSYLRNPKKPLDPSSVGPVGGGRLFCGDGRTGCPAGLSLHLESARKTLRQGKGFGCWAVGRQDTQRKPSEAR